MTTSVRRAALVLGALIVAAPVARTQQPFEGVIAVQFTSPDGQLLPMTYMIKGNKFRMDMTLGPMTITSVFDPAAKKVYVLMPAQQMYMETTTDSALAAAATGAAQSRKPEVTWTGQKETIAGTECEHATVTGAEPSGGATTFDMCVARGITFVPPMQGGMAGAGADWQRAIEGGFPLKLQRAGDLRPMLLVTSIDRRPLGDDVFAGPPAGWQKMPMPARP